MQKFILTNDLLGLPSVQFPDTSDDWYLDVDTSNAYVLTKEIHDIETVMPPIIITRLFILEGVDPDYVRNTRNSLEPPYEIETEAGNMIVSRRAVFVTMADEVYQMDIIGICSTEFIGDQLELKDIMKRIEVI